MRLSTYTRLDPGFQICRDIRTAIFVEGLNVPISTERDNQDYGATHYLIRLRDNTVIGVARSHIEGEQCKIQRFGLLAEYRNNDIRAQALALLIKDCNTRYPFIPLQVYAQPHEIEFYAGFGFMTEGDTFHYAGFHLQAMTLPAINVKTALTNPDLAVTNKIVQAV